MRDSSALQGAIAAPPSSRMIVVYVSGHGFGHGTRMSEVLRAVRKAAPAQPLTVVTGAPEALFREAEFGPFAYRHLSCDVGLAQRGALVIDEAETLSRWQAFEAERPALVSREAAWLREVGARLVVADLPPLAFEAAAAAGVASVGLANFSWDWIYGHLAKRHPGFAEPARAAAAAYAHAMYRFVLEIETDESVLPSNVIRVTRAALEAAGLRYLDVIGAADVVVTKPGYGIVTDCIAAGSRLVYTDRGDFPEYPILVAEMACYLPCAHVTNDDLRSGRLGPAIDTVLHQPLPPPPRLDGAAVGARRLLEMVAGLG